MMIRTNLALRNLARNYRRTLLNISMIVAGFAAIVLFQGFGAYVMKALRDTFISVQYGHLQVGADVSWNMQSVDDANDLLVPDPEAVVSSTASIADFKFVTGRLSFYGMLSTDKNSVSARAVGYEPALEVGMRDGMMVPQGRALNAEDSFSIMLGEGLVKSLQVNVGDQLTIIAQTVEGALNAIEVSIVGISRTGVAEIDNMTFYIPIKTAQRLLDTDRVERLVYFLPPERHQVLKEQQALSKVLPAGLSARRWDELATLYQQTESFFNTQDAIISTIILTLVLLSISNTVSNSVIERTGEIGTVRAMGDRRLDVISQFFMESLLLSLISGSIAIVLSYGISTAINSSGALIPMPGSTMPVPLLIEVVPMTYVRAFILTSCTAIVATLYPAWKVSKLPIVEALRRNI